MALSREVGELEDADLREGKKDYKVAWRMSERRCGPTGMLQVRNLQSHGVKSGF